MTKDPKKSGKSKAVVRRPGRGSGRFIVLKDRRRIFDPGEGGGKFSRAEIREAVRTARDRRLAKAQA